ncbi:hypothetical protein EGW08_017485 [Elysia chlorotica]|uniref:C-type lectin domain-containing protein n=1 Tax=Elysia chlorotica TaxID=188477 RepID=A0A433SZM8_ELYCH|nr:hypothetical protein EGW08_017485 [Elysia chlorotica]
MADDEEFDFFKPHPNPKPRVKTSFFEVVPDAFDDKSLTFTGDHRRTPKKVAPEPKEPETSPEPETEPKETKPAATSAAVAAMSGAGVQETMFSHDVCMTSAEPWSPGDRTANMNPYSRDQLGDKAAHWVGLKYYPEEKEIRWNGDPKREKSRRSEKETYCVMLTTPVRGIFLKVSCSEHVAYICGIRPRKNISIFIDPFADFRLSSLLRLKLCHNQNIMTKQVTATIVSD